MKQDLLLGLRALSRERAFGLTAMLVLGLGIGVNNMLFTLIYGHTMRGLPIDRADRVLHISTIDERGADRGLSLEQVDAIRVAREFSGVAVFTTRPTIIADEGRAPERLQGAYVSANAFDVIGIAPIVGRRFTEQEDRPGHSPVVIVGASLWRSRYGTEASILGRSILVDGTPATVVGVLPDRSGLPSTAAVWVPLSRLPPASMASQHDALALQGFGRIAEGRAIVDARAEIEAIIAATAAPDAPSESRLRARVVPISEPFFGRATDPAWLAFISVGFLVLVISCANTANLMLARSVRRTREFAVRASLGASRTRLIIQLLTEGLVLATGGGMIGFAISRLGVRAFSAWIPQGVLPYWMHYAMDGRVFATLVLFSLATLLIFGLVPAIQASRPDVNRLLKGGGRRTIGRRTTRRLTTGFLAIQVALTVILLCYTVNDVRTSAPELVSDAAIRTPGILSVSITLPPDRYPTTDARRSFFEQLLEQVEATAGVESATLTTALPLRPAVEQRLELESQPNQPADAHGSVWSMAIAPRYFQTLHLTMIEGREFSADARLPGHSYAIVNQRFVELYFSGSSAVGKRIRLHPIKGEDPKSEWLEIVGVSPSIRQRLAANADPIAYVPLHTLAPPGPVLLIRRIASSESVVAAVRETVRTLDWNLPLDNVMTLERAMEDVEWVGRLSSGLIRFLTLVALALSIVGLYAVTAHSVNQRAPELGVRIALGARPRALRGLVVGRAIWQVTLGLVLGVLGTLAWDAVFFSGRVEQRFASPEIVAPVALVLIAVTLLACVIPIRRATRLDPIAVLREE